MTLFGPCLRNSAIPASTGTDRYRHVIVIWDAGQQSPYRWIQADGCRAGSDGGGVFVVVVGFDLHGRVRDAVLLLEHLPRVISPPITSMAMYVAVSPNAMVSGRTCSAAADPGLGRGCDHDRSR